METLLTKSVADISAVLAGEGDISPTDKLGRRLLLTIQRRRAGMDWLIDTRSRGRVRPRVRRVLWWALAELLWMDGVPAPAVVDTAVAFVKRRYSQNDAAYANGLLRGILRNVEEKGVESLFFGAPLHVRFWLPEFLCRRWVEQFGTAEAERLAGCLQQPAKTIMRLRKWPRRDENLPPGLISVPAPEWASEA